MIKFIVAAVWICAVTAGAAIYSFQNAGAKADDTPKPLITGASPPNSRCTGGVTGAGEAG